MTLWDPHTAEVADAIAVSTFLAWFVVGLVVAGLRKLTGSGEGGAR